uniref:Uncharacterized protein n=1 Tax=Aegilops tauschii subsp. strangulata TaxID=200361 RepID=A0A452YXR2_AEGTS
PFSRHLLFPAPPYPFPPSPRPISTERKKGDGENPSVPVAGESLGGGEGDDDAG